MTGVQTCALPIYYRATPFNRRAGRCKVVVIPNSEPESMNMADALTTIDRGNDLLHFRLARRTFLHASAAAGVSGLVASFSEVVGAAEPMKPREGAGSLPVTNRHVKAPRIGLERSGKVDEKMLEFSLAHRGALIGRGKIPDSRTHR